jgi:hypothetical protein
VASLEECREALHELSTRLEASSEARSKLSFDRTLACRITDLGAAFHGRLVNGRLTGIADGDDPDAKIAITLTSDDLIALVRRRLDLPRALATRRVSISASPLDLLRLRKLL